MPERTPIETVYLQALSDSQTVAADLRSRLAAARGRIAALEAELAELKPQTVEAHDGTPLRVVGPKGLNSYDTSVQPTWITGQLRRTCGITSDGRCEGCGTPAAEQCPCCETDDPPAETA